MLLTSMTCMTLLQMKMRKEAPLCAGQVPVNRSSLDVALLALELVESRYPAL